MNINDIKADEENPRKITASAKKQLSQSISDFENISEITWNSRTKELVAGHQRFSELKAKYKNLNIKETDKPDWFDFVDEGGQFIGFRLRVVDWDKEKQKAGNIVANSTFSQGEFDKEKLEIVLNKYDFKDFQNFSFKDIPIRMEKIDKGLNARDEIRFTDSGPTSAGEFEFITIPFNAEEYLDIKEKWDSICQDMRAENPALETQSDVFRAIIDSVLQASEKP